MRIEQLTFTRFIAAIAIVIFHYGGNSFLLNTEAVSFIFKQANLGVSYFFILSGFVMIIAYNSRSNIHFLDFIKNRLARIYPVYLLAILLVLMVTLFKSINYTDLALNILMLQSWFPSKALTLNVPGWSLSIELFFYVTFPWLLQRYYKKYSLKKIAICIVTIWILSQVIYHALINEVIVIPQYSVKDYLYHPVLHINQFLIGNLAGLYFIKNYNRLKQNYLAAIIIVLILILIAFRFPLGLSYHNGLLAILFVPFILMLSASTDRITGFFKGSVFVFLGEISYGIYILQFPVWIICSDYRMDKYLGLNKELDFTLSFFIRLGFLILLASLSYLYFEKPARIKLKKVWDSNKS